MPVVVTDVRVALNNISEEELSSLTIEQKIRDAEAKADENSLPAGDARDRFVRDWAAYLGFIVSKTYTNIRLGDIQLQRSFAAYLENLRKRAEESLEEATGQELAISSTPMFDDRPKDPYDSTDLGGVP